MMLRNLKVVRAAFKRTTLAKKPAGRGRGAPANESADDSGKQSPNNEPLFRSEALAEQQSQWLGTVLLAPKLTYGMFALFAALSAAGVVCLLLFADYTRKERIDGWLVPQQGLMRVFAPQAGVITELRVADGDRVARGAPLFALSTELRSEALGATQEEVVRRLRDRRDSILADVEVQQEMQLQESESLTNRIGALGNEQLLRDRELEVQRQRVELAAQSLERLQDARERGLLAEQRWQQLEDERLDHVLRLSSLERERAEVERERMTLTAEREALPLKYRAQLAETERNAAALEQELAEAEARRRIVVVAPQAGTVTAIQASLGARADPAIPLLAVIPADSQLQAELFIPSRARGFIRPGQQVLLRYQAFPYQKFGHYQGTVTNIARSAMTPAELSRQLAGIAGVSAAEEPVYPVTVQLDSQTAMAYGEQIPLQPGMQLQADVQIETRSLFEWMLAPLYTLAGT